jgi:uncharacterized protein
MRRTLLRLGVVLVLLAPVAGVVQAQDIPTVYLYVNDLASPHALLGAEARDIEDICFQLDLETTAEIAVLIVNTTQPLGINLFAVRTFEANGIGKEGLDNGVLIVISTDERAWRIEVGYGLQGVLPAGFVGRVGTDNITPYLAAGDYYGGLYEGTVEVGQRILDRYEPPTGERPTPDLIVVNWRAVAIGVGIFILLSVITKGKILFWFGNIFMRGGFGGGRSGGGGARGKF